MRDTAGEFSYNSSRMTPPRFELIPSRLCGSLPGRASDVRARVVAGLLAGVVAASGALAAPAPGAAEFEICQSCHGTRGQGTHALEAPRIAGLEEGYVSRQLAAFREGRRGGTGDSAPAAQMASIAQSLTDASAARVAGFVAALPGTPVERTVNGDPGKGEQLFAPCAACHGPLAEGSAATGAPRLAGMSDWYLLRQLNAFRYGRRGAAVATDPAAAMRAMALTLPDDRAARDVVAYATSLAGPGPVPMPAGDTRP